LKSVFNDSCCFAPVGGFFRMMRGFTISKGYSSPQPKRLCFKHLVWAWGLGVSLSVIISLSNSTSVQAEMLQYAPCAGQFTSDFGWRTDPMGKGRRFHAGMDIANATGTAVYAAESGQVVYAGWYGGYGNVVVLQHSPELFTLYGHLSGFDVALNQWVNQGDTIAKMGSTGRSTGPHLHFEVHYQRQYLDPKVFLLDVQQRLLAGHSGSSYTHGSGAGDTVYANNSQGMRVTVSENSPYRNASHITPDDSGTRQKSPASERVEVLQGVKRWFVEVIP
jgi:Peptidase family M23